MKERGREREKGYSQAFFSGASEERNETDGQSLFYLLQKESIREARLYTLLVFFFLFIS